MRDEIKFYKNLEHLNIVTLIDSGIDEAAVLPDYEVPLYVPFTVT